MCLEHLPHRAYIHSVHDGGEDEGQDRLNGVSVEADMAVCVPRYNEHNEQHREDSTSTGRCTTALRITLKKGMGESKQKIKENKSLEEFHV